jgi:hypothetical protein
LTPVDLLKAQAKSRFAKIEMTAAYCLGSIDDGRSECGIDAIEGFDETRFGRNIVS